MEFRHLQEQPVIRVVEDGHKVQRIVDVILTDGGFEAAIASSGEEAVTLLDLGRTWS